MESAPCARRVCAIFFRVPHPRRGSPVPCDEAALPRPPVPQGGRRAHQSQTRPESLCEKGWSAYTMGLHALSSLECIMSRTPYPSDLTDAQWELLAPLIPPAQPGGHP